MRSAWPMPLKPGEIASVAEFRSIHRDFQKGIYVPSGSDIAVSIRFRPRRDEEWGYADRWLAEGRSLDYTGQGGPPASQSWNRFNLGLKLASESRSPIHVFEELSGSPRTYRYWGEWLITRWYEHFDPGQNRTLLRFVMEVPD
jgi:SAD/SRA domain